MTEGSLSEAVHRLMHAYKHLLREGVQRQKIELPVTQIRVLKAICRNDQINAQSIAKRMQRDKAQVTRALNDLIRDGLIVKGDNPLDRRSQLLNPTSEGRAVMTKLDSVEEWAVQQLTAKLESDELAFFLRISQTMADSAKQVGNTEKGES
ncbi:MarR family winged helix-turn-helix transcriptional regulator [Marinobacter salexigens]|uniref:MarR family transcriptional regulator n=1 Tax=Marinobacter salexigens TaxID=1925763 RepID=A0ABS6A722_9GAMM|nr:MarR family transcriptional regulator [Marinobacter salexigens]MBU2873951.1 MarR family transcriptional regulator [Marinobacter salexigens]